MDMIIFSQNFAVSFGDCDPAGIVFYPNFFRWMDATYHGLLKERAGGHEAVCQKLGARGTGLLDARISFRSPAKDGDVLRFQISEIDWSQRKFDVNYRVMEGERLILEGQEQRGVFIDRDERIGAGQVEPLRVLLGLS